MGEASDDRNELLERIAALERRVAALERRLAAPDHSPCEPGARAMGIDFGRTATDYGRHPSVI